jgi:hypothetical protein
MMGLWIRLAGAAGTLVLAIERIGPALLAIGRAATTGLVPLLAAMGPAGWLILGLGAIIAAAITFSDSWEPVLKWFSEGINSIITAVKLLIILVREAAFQLGLAKTGAEALFQPGGLFDQAAKSAASDTKTPGTPDATDSGGANKTSDQQSAYDRRFAAENPTLVQHQTGGWVGERPISAESGEFVTRRSMAERFSGLLEAINSGNLGGIADRLSGILPAPMALAPAGAGGGGGHSGNGEAMFHLTIGDKTYKNLKAPRETAEAMLDHARQENLSSGGVKPSWYGSK